MNKAANRRDNSRSQPTGELTDGMRGMRLGVKRERLYHLLVIVAAGHIAVLSLTMGLRHPGYLVTTMLSATLIWGAVFFLSERKRRTGLIAGLLLGALVQQAAYHVWKTELPGFWGPLVQFGAVQFLIACGIGKVLS